MSQGCALLILRSKGQRSRSWRMVIWKWFPDDNWLCNQPMIMKLHTLTHHESRMRPIDFEVKRSRSWRMVIWKWFPDDNWLCNQPMIMKLHTLTPHESRMCPIDFGVKRSMIKVMAHGYLKMVHRNNGGRFEFVGVGGGPVLLQQYFQYAFICCPYMLPLLFLKNLVVDAYNICIKMLGKVQNYAKTVALTYNPPHQSRVTGHHHS